MQAYFAALIALSLAGVIEARSTTPGLRPEAPAADRAFRILGRTAFAFWLVLLAWGFWELHWTQPVSGLILSLGANALLVQAGARPSWPGISMGLSLLGLVLTVVVLSW
ncbi:multidrug DMT transporter permease [Roseicella aerolata]|uniref:Multidrug DMT transporter permease n=1 Tax=Roseicella aerolata TaxID=2883479 RepID=A0A9X1LB29_9PROT|nr:multidrug DMT transporter permease [Roseicella aerolata]MCB4822067.1 multidrug DMT transporter permease [Roseicella aerolata]